jgi:hypothetical protein
MTLWQLSGNVTACFVRTAGWLSSLPISRDLGTDTFGNRGYTWTRLGIYSFSLLAVSGPALKGGLGNPGHAHK